MSRLGVVIVLVLFAAVTFVLARQLSRKQNNVAPPAGTAPDAIGSSDSPIAREAIVPGKLIVGVYLHSLESSEGPVPCWTYVSSGLWPLGQKEIVVTVKRRPGESQSAYPRDLLQFYGLVYRLAIEKHVVDIGAATTLSPDGAPFLGRKEFRAVLYAPAQSLKGVPVHAPWLTGLILTRNELAVANEYGMVRLTTALGSRYRFFPTAPWADRDRAELVTPHEMESSLLSKTNRSQLYAASTRLENRKRVVLRIRPAAKGRLSELMSRSAAGEPITLMTGPEPSADAYVVWRAGTKAYSAISKPRTAGELIGGNFITLVPQQDEDGGLAIEDGFGVLLRDESWIRLRRAVENGESLSIPATGDRMPFALVFAPEVEGDFADPIESQFPAGWGEFDRGGTPPADRSKPVFLRNIVLLTTEDVVSGRIGVRQLSDHVKQLEAIVGSQFAAQPPGPGMDLALLVELRPDGSRSLQLLTRPEAKVELMDGLKQALMKVQPPPSFFGPVRFQLNFLVWGGSAPARS